MACRDEDAYGRISLYWLLYRSDELQTGATGGLVERASSKIIEPVCATLMPLERYCMLVDSARAVLDQTLRKARKRGRFTSLPNCGWQPVRFIAGMLAGLDDRKPRASFERIESSLGAGCRRARCRGVWQKTWQM